MGQSIQIADATFSRVVSSLTLPDRVDLIGEYLFGGNFAASSRNLANPSIPLLEVGAPVYSTWYATVRSGASGYGFNTQLTPVVDNTMISVSGPLSIGASTYMAAAGQSGFFARSGNNIFKGGVYSILDHGAVNNGDGAAWSFRCGVTNSGAGIAKHHRGNSTTGVMTTASASNARTGTSTGLLHIGGPVCTSTITTDDHSTAYFAVYNRTLTDVEVAAAYAALRAFFARRSIVI